MLREHLKNHINLVTKYFSKNKNRNNNKNKNKQPLEPVLCTRTNLYLKKKPSSLFFLFKILMSSKFFVKNQSIENSPLAVAFLIGFDLKNPNKYLNKYDTL